MKKKIKLILVALIPVALIVAIFVAVKLNNNKTYDSMKNHFGNSWSSELSNGNSRKKGNRDFVSTSLATRNSGPNSIGGGNDNGRN